MVIFATEIYAKWIDFFGIDDIFIPSNATVVRTQYFP